MAVHHIKQTAIYIKYLSDHAGRFLPESSASQTLGGTEYRADRSTRPILRPILYVNVERGANAFESYQIILKEVKSQIYGDSTFEIDWTQAIDNATRVGVNNVNTLSDVDDLIRQYNPTTTATDALAHAANGNPVANGAAIITHDIVKSRLHMNSVNKINNGGVNNNILIDLPVVAAATNQFAQKLAGQPVPFWDLLANAKIDSTVTAGVIGSAGGLASNDQVGHDTLGVMSSIDQLPHHTAYVSCPNADQINMLKVRLKGLDDIFSKGNMEIIATRLPPTLGGGNKSRRRKRYTQKNIIE